MTDNITNEPSNMLPPVVNDQTMPAAPMPDPVASLTGQLPPAALPPAFPQQGNDPLVGNVQIPDVAADADLIEKEWVDKAKQIVEHTADDPFKQQEEISKMKADYLKKRYNKELGKA